MILASSLLTSMKLTSVWYYSMSSRGLHGDGGPNNFLVQKGGLIGEGAKR